MYLNINGTKYIMYLSGSKFIRTINYFINFNVYSFIFSDFRQLLQGDEGFDACFNKVYVKNKKSDCIN